MNKDMVYTVSDTDCDEAITQEVYIQAGFKTSVCILILNTGFEAVGHYAPIDLQDVNISVGKEKSRIAAMSQVKQHLEAISQWKKAVDDVRAQEAEVKNSADPRDMTNDPIPSNGLIPEENNS